MSDDYIPQYQSGPTYVERLASLKILRTQCEARNTAAVLAEEAETEAIESGKQLPNRLENLQQRPEGLRNYVKDGDAAAATQKKRTRADEDRDGQTPSASDQYRKHLRRLQGVYGKQQMTSANDEESVATRVADDFQRTQRRRDKFHTRRTTFEEIAKTGINDANQKFNEKLWRQSDARTQAMRRDQM